MTRGANFKLQRVNSNAARPTLVRRSTGEEYLLDRRVFDATPVVDLTKRRIFCDDGVYPIGIAPSVDGGFMLVVLLSRSCAWINTNGTSALTCD